MRFRLASYCEGLVELVAEREIGGKIALKIFRLQMRRRLRSAPEHTGKEMSISGLTSRAEPLRLMLVAVRLKSDQFRNLSVKPGERVRKWNAGKFADVSVFTRPGKAAAAIAPLVESDDHSPIKRRCVVSAGCMAYMMIEALHAIPGARRHIAYDSKIVQLTAQLTGCFIQEIDAGFGGERRESRAKKNRARPRATRPGSDSDSIDVPPPNASAIQAKLYGAARYPFDGACPGKLSLFDRGDHTIFADDRGGRTML